MTNARWWHKTENGRFQCDLCPRGCRLKPGQRGFCFIREATEEGIELKAYGKTSGFSVDPIEKKPLNHFFPGSGVLSFGTIGCNLGCKFCQNWGISKVQAEQLLRYPATPLEIAQMAVDENCGGVAFTYNDPVTSAEYTIDTARECKKRNLYTVAVTAGYITPLARSEFFEFIDAANIDLKGFTDSFYRKYSLANLAPVLDTLKYVARSTHVWLEVTTLLIPGLNDSSKELDEMTRWFAGELGPEVPLHFTAFHPAYLLQDRPPTPPSTLMMAAEVAEKNGIQYIYLGNTREAGKYGDTRCPGCQSVLIRRDGFTSQRVGLVEGRCAHCKKAIPGRWVS